MKKYSAPIMMILIFEAIAITLWLTKDNIFYLFNFSYIGCSIALGMFLFIRRYRHARRIVQLLVGSYMLVYLGLICNENRQIEGFWYYLFTGVCIRDADQKHEAFLDLSDDISIYAHFCAAATLNYYSHNVKYLL